MIGAGMERKGYVVGEVVKGQNSRMRSQNGCREMKGRVESAREYAAGRIWGSGMEMVSSLLGMLALR